MEELTYLVILPIFREMLERCGHLRECRRFIHTRRVR